MMYVHNVRGRKLYPAAADMAAQKVHGSRNKMPPKCKRRHHLVLVVVHPVPQDLPKKNKVKAQHPDRLVVVLLTTMLELAAPHPAIAALTSSAPAPPPDRILVGG